MKSAFAIFILFLGIQSHAKVSATIRVSEFYCGEIDSFVFGDACVLTGASKKNKFSIILDFKNYSDYDPLVKPGDLVHINIDLLEQIDFRALDIDAQNEYWNLFGYVRTNIYHITQPGAITSIDQIKDLHELILECSTDDIHVNDFLYGHITVKAHLGVKSFKTFEITEIELDYKLTMDEQQGEVWSEGFFKDKGYSVLNMYHYKPFKYKNHIKFPGLYSHKGIGEVDLILPVIELKKSSQLNNFQGIIILTAIDDHAGGSVQVNCSTKSIQ